MKSKTIIYETEVTPKVIYEVITYDTNQNLINLSIDPFENSTYNVYSRSSFILFKPNLGPLVKLNIEAKSVKDKLSQIQFKRINGTTYYVQMIFSGLVGLIGFLIAIYIMDTRNFNEGIGFLTLTIFSMLYLLIIESIVTYSITSLKKRIIAALKNSKIEIKKIG